MSAKPAPHDDTPSGPVPVEFTPEEFLALLESALAGGYASVHDFVIDTAAHGRKGGEPLPANVLPFPSQTEGERPGQSQ